MGTNPTTNERPAAQEPWQSWGTTTRCLILRLAEVAPSVLLVWQTYLHK